MSGHVENHNHTPPLPAAEGSPIAHREGGGGGVSDPTPTSPVEFFTHDVLNDPLPTGFDAFTCSLFLHHLDEPDVVALLTKLRAANPRLILVNDLERSRFNYAAVWAAARLLSRSRVVHVDGPLSIRGAFTVGEMRSLAEAAGLSGSKVRASFPCRMLLEWRAGV